MRTQTRASSMVEIIIAIGVLAVVSMFVIQLFVKASNIERKAHDLDIACLEAQKLMEQAKTEGGYRQETHYDHEWNPVGERADEGYSITTRVENNGALNIIHIEVHKNQPYLMEKQSQMVYDLVGSTRREVSEL